MPRRASARRRRRQLSRRPGPKLSLYGFIDFSYAKHIAQERSTLTDLIARDSFAIGAVNLYLDANIAPQWRSLAEIRAHYAPNGVEDLDFSTGNITTTDTSYVDLNDYTTETRWGGIELERVWLEYAAFPWLRLKAGIWLTPYGIWNVDHGSPTIVGVRLPTLVQQALFPERQAGVQVDGSWGFDEWTIKYAMTLSNGRGSFDGIRDLDGNKAIGGRFAVEWNGSAQLSVGASGYYGRHTAGRRILGTVEDPTKQLPTFDVVVETQSDELALGADLRFTWQGLLVQAELAGQRVAYTDEGRPPAVAGIPGLQPDHLRWGGYGLAGYRIAFLGLMPYAMYEFTDFGAPVLIEGASSLSLGINARPVPAVTLKVEYSRHSLSEVSIAGRSSSLVSSITTQAAWAF